jgi:hypothetical protein
MLIKPTLFQPLKGHYRGVRTVTSTRTYMQYKCVCTVQIYVWRFGWERLLLSEVQMYTDSYSLAKSVMTLFLWLYEFTGVPCLCSNIWGPEIVTYINVLALYVTWLRNYMQSSTVNGWHSWVSCVTSSVCGLGSWLLGFAYFNSTFV